MGLQFDAIQCRVRQWLKNYHMSFVLILQRHQFTGIVTLCSKQVIDSSRDATMDVKVRALLKNASLAAVGGANRDEEASNGLLAGAFGRLGNSEMELKDEPRLHAKLAAIMGRTGLDRYVPSPDLALLQENSSLDEIAAWIERFENGMHSIYYESSFIDLPTDVDDPKVDVTTEVIKGGDGQDMNMYIYRSNVQETESPGIVYFHGGGMTVGSTLTPVHERWCKTLALQGCVVAMPDFRNAWTKTGYHHFPAGLNDCVAAVKFILANKTRLQISQLILQGESGGANLSFAVALKANQDGWVKEIDGVFGAAPYISNAYGWTTERKLNLLPSLIENDGYFINTHSSTFLAFFHSPRDRDIEDALAWPYYATEQDMTGLPPHVVICDELDPLRDEGISYARRLAKAGVSCEAGLNVGTVHGASLIFRSAIPEYHHSMAERVASFARRL